MNATRIGGELLNMFFYIIVFLVVLVASGTAVSNYFLWQHISSVSKKLNEIFKGKSSDDFYNFIHGGSGINISNTDVENVEDES